MTIDTARLRELAGKATPGKWHNTYNRREVRVGGNAVCRSDLICEIHTRGIGYDQQCFYDGDYIAALSPDVVIELLDRLEKAETAAVAICHTCGSENGEFVCYDCIQNDSDEVKREAQ